MPLIKGCSKEAAKKNYSKLKDEGMDDSQAYAAALSNAQKYKKKCSKQRQKELEDGNLF